MEITARVINVDGGLGIQLPAEIVQALGIQAGNELLITIMEKHLALQSLSSEFAQQVAEFVEQNRQTLEALAKK